MEHICPKCNILMDEANLDHAGLIRIYKKGEEKREGFFDFSNAHPSYMSQINQFVCSNCGYIEFYAEAPEKFK